MVMIQVMQSLLNAQPHQESVTATDGIATFDTDFKAPIEAAIPFEPKQDLSQGDPSPDNICPIEGWTGCNVWHGDGSTSPLFNVTNVTPLHNRESLTIDAETNTIRCQGSGLWGGFRSPQISLVAGHTYILDADITYRSGELYWGFRKTNNTYIGSSDGSVNWYVDGKRAIASQNRQTSGHFVEVFIPDTNITVTIDGLVSGSSSAAGDITFANVWAGEVNDIPITFTDPSTGDPMTIYGGTVTINPDGSADILQTVGGKVLDDTQDWRMTQNGRFDILRGFQDFNTNNEPNTWISNLYPYNGFSQNISASTQFGFYTSSSQTATTGRQCIFVDDSKDLTSFLAMLRETPLIVCGPLLTPISYHFSDIGKLKSWLGQNNLWADLDSNPTVKYWKHG